MTQPTPRGSAVQTAFASGSSVTQAFTTVSGDSALTILVFAEDGSDDAVTSVTHNGSSANVAKITGTDATASLDGGGVQGRCEAWRVVSPTVGTSDVVVTFAGTTNGSITIQAWVDVDTGTPASSGTTANSPTSSLTPSFTRSPGTEDIVVAGVYGPGTNPVSTITTADTAIGAVVRETYYTDGAHLSAYATDGTVNFTFAANQGYIGFAFLLHGTGGGGGGGAVSHRSGIAISGVSAINGISKASVSHIDGLTI